MNEFSNTRLYEMGFRRRLLATASSITLLGATFGAELARASDGDHPLVWIELNGQFAQQNAGNEAFLPPFLHASQFDGASQIGRTAQSVWNEGAKISFQPEGSDWVFVAGILYGRATKHGSQSELTNHLTTKNNVFFTAYQNVSAKNIESHTVLDFQAGRDVGLGKFGSGGSSLLSFGVRYAQFDSRSGINMASQPTNVIHTHHRFYASSAIQRKFTGAGPSLSWDASAGLVGKPAAGHVSFDWGVNGAILFGRQQVRGRHQVTEEDATFITTRYTNSYGQHIHQAYSDALSPSRRKSVIVPNLGGFAGVSWRYPNAKVSVGYRADFFFGAMDGGIDTARRENVGFYGPFASVSIGIGG